MTDVDLDDAPWQVIDEGRSLLVGQYFIGPGNTTSTLVVGFGDDELLVLSPGPDPDEAALAALQRRGRVSALLAPNGFHRAGLASWARSFPDASVHAADGALARVGARVEPVQDLESLRPRLGPDVDLLVLPHMRSGEVWLATQGSKAALYTGDAFTNLAPGRGFSSVLLGLLGLRPGLRRNPWQRRLMARDRAAYDRWLLSTLDALQPAVLIPGHGAVLEEADLAARLAALVG